MFTYLRRLLAWQSVSAQFASNQNPGLGWKLYMTTWRPPITFRVVNWLPTDVSGVQLLKSKSDWAPPCCHNFHPNPAKTEFSSYPLANEIGELMVNTSACRLVYFLPVYVKSYFICYTEKVIYQVVLNSMIQK